MDPIEEFVRKYRKEISQAIRNSTAELKDMSDETDPVDLIGYGIGYMAAMIALEMNAEEGKAEILLAIEDGI